MSGGIAIGIFRAPRVRAISFRGHGWQWPALVGVLVCHLLVLRNFPVLGGGISEPERDIQAMIISSPTTKPVAEPVLQRPSLDIVPAPEIIIDEGPKPTAVAAVSEVLMSQVVPPRPDPSHVNPAPHLPTDFGKLADASALVMVFVAADGSITQARIFSSTGHPSLDAFILDYVKSQWRFLPAFASGHSIAEWTTVRVPVRG